MRLARIAAIALLGIALVSTVACSSNEQPNLDGIYEDAIDHGYLVKFEGGTVIFDYQNHQNNPDVATYSIPDGIENGSTILVTNALNDTYPYYFEYHGNCIKIDQATFCKIGTENTDNGNNGDIATYGKEDIMIDTYNLYGLEQLHTRLTPTDGTQANTIYVVDLYEKGNYRDSSTVQWNQPQLNVKEPADVYFSLNHDEYEAYWQCYVTTLDCYLNGIFSVTVHQ
jgi:hypothetical protein